MSREILWNPLTVMPPTWAIEEAADQLGYSLAPWPEEALTEQQRREIMVRAFEILDEQHERGESA